MEIFLPRHRELVHVAFLHDIKHQTTHFDLTSTLNGEKEGGKKKIRPTLQQVFQLISHLK